MFPTAKYFNIVNHLDVWVTGRTAGRALFNTEQNPTAYSTGPSNSQYAKLMVN